MITAAKASAKRCPSSTLSSLFPHPHDTARFSLATPPHLIALPPRTHCCAHPVRLCCLLYSHPHASNHSVWPPPHSAHKVLRARGSDDVKTGSHDGSRLLFVLAGRSTYCACFLVRPQSARRDRLSALHSCETGWEFRRDFVNRVAHIIA